METIGVIFGIYMSLALLITVWGLGHLFYCIYHKIPTKKPVKLLITGAIMILIGFGACTITLIGI